jgi:hypothetical protein
VQPSAEYVHRFSPPPVSNAIIWPPPVTTPVPGRAGQPGRAW